MNKQILKELNEFSNKNELLKKEEKILLDKTNQIDIIKKDVINLDKEKKSIKENLFFYKKEIEKMKNR